jgi:2'-5' RNA ligase
MIRYALYLAFDPHTESALQKLREAMAMQVKGVPSVTGKMLPHLTLLVFDDDDSENVVKKFEVLITSVASLPIVLGGIDAFEGRRNVLYVKPTLSQPLKEQQERCFNCFSGSNIVSDYRSPSRWKAHVTLTKGIDADTLVQARALAEKMWIPRQSVTTSIGLINVQKPLQPYAVCKLL